VYDRNQDREGSRKNCLPSNVIYDELEQELELNSQNNWQCKGPRNCDPRSTICVPVFEEFSKSEVHPSAAN
jgi:hypothetical protein